MSGRRWPYVGLILGGGVSVACNVGHAYVVSAAPAVGAVALSVVWPVLVLVAVELVARSVWPAGWTWTAVRVGGLGLVAVVAAVVSYRHMAGLLDHYGEDAVVVALGPVAIDGLMVMATAALLAAARTSTAVAPATVAPVAPVAPVASTVVEAATAVGVGVTEVRAAAPSLSMSTPTVDPTAPVVGVDALARPSTMAGPPALDERGDGDLVAAPATTPTDTDTATTSTAVATVASVESSGSSGSSVRQERVGVVRALIASGDLAPAPSAEAIRRAVGGSVAVARAVRDVVAEDDVQIPGQLTALDALDASGGPSAVAEQVRLEVVR